MLISAASYPVDVSPTVLEHIEDHVPSQAIASVQILQHSPVVQADPSAQGAEERRLRAFPKEELRA